MRRSFNVTGILGESWVFSLLRNAAITWMQVGFNTRHEMSSWNTYLNFTNLDHRELKEWRQRRRQGYQICIFNNEKQEFCTLCRNRSRPINGEFKKWRKQWQRQRHKSIIWLVEWWKVIVLHVRHLFWWRNRSNDDMKVSLLRFWRQRRPTVVNLSFFVFARKCTSPILYNVSNLK